MSLVLSKKRSLSESADSINSNKRVKHGGEDYDKFAYEIIEREREQADVIYSICRHNNIEQRNAFVSDLPKLIVDTHSVKEVTYAGNPDGVDGLTKKEFEILQKAAKGDFLQYFIFFNSLYLSKHVRSFFCPEKDNIKKDETTPPPPLVNSREALHYFIRNPLHGLCERFMNGQLVPTFDSMAIGSDPVCIFVETVVGLYVKTCGIHIPR